MKTEEYIRKVLCANSGGAKYTELFTEVINAFFQKKLKDNRLSKDTLIVDVETMVRNMEDVGIFTYSYDKGLE